jgi:hypothetical protein
MALKQHKGGTIGGAFLAFAFVLAAITALYLGESYTSRGEQKESLAELPALTPPAAEEERFYELAGRREYNQPGRSRLSLDLVVLPPVTQQRVRKALLQAEADARMLYPDVAAMLLFAFASSEAQRLGARPIASLEWAGDRRGFEGTRPGDNERSIALEATLLR